MPALDSHHRAVVHALQKEGWTITHDPLTLRLEQRLFYIDVGAERLLAAERGVEKIAVEIKTFSSPSAIADLEQALGQFGIYEEVLQAIEPTRQLYLAVPEYAFNTIFAERIGKLILQNRIRHAVCFSPDREEIVLWLP